MKGIQCFAFFLISSGHLFKLYCSATSSRPECSEIVSATTHVLPFYTDCALQSRTIYEHQPALPCGVRTVLRVSFCSFGRHSRPVDHSWLATTQGNGKTQQVHDKHPYIFWCNKPWVIKLIVGYKVVVNCDARNNNNAVGNQSQKSHPHPID